MEVWPLPLQVGHTLCPPLPTYPFPRQEEQLAIRVSFIRVFTPSMASLKLTFMV
jgi:hypothetical protein